MARWEFLLQDAGWADRVCWWRGEPQAVGWGIGGAVEIDFGILMPAS